jgi:hypothetical protein
MDTAVVLPLIGAIVSLVGVIVWAVRFTLNKVFGKNGEDGAWGKLLKRLDNLGDGVTDLRRDQTLVLTQLRTLCQHLEAGQGKGQTAPATHRPDAGA